MARSKTQVEEKWLTLVPAYGRDYTSAEAVLAHWKEGKDFLIQDISCKWSGSYTSCRDFEDDSKGLNHNVFKIRFDGLREIALVRLVKGNWTVQDANQDEED